MLPTTSAKVPIQSTAGAVSVKNEKGQIITEKVRVARYVAGKRPEFATGDSSESEEEEQVFPAPKIKQRERAKAHSSDEEDRDSRLAEDPKWRHLNQSSSQLKARRHSSDDIEENYRHSRARRPSSSSSSRSYQSSAEHSASRSPQRERFVERRATQDSSEEEENLSEEELDRRRKALRQRAKLKEEEELLAQEDEGASEEEESEDSEYEEYTDSEEEAGPRLKPVFVSKRDRITLQETEREQQRLRNLQLEQKKMADDRKRQSVKIVEDLIKLEQEQERKGKEEKLNLEAVNTDDENEELAYESWKLRELKRIKRDKEENESFEKDKLELERIHNMTEEERRAYLRANPKVVTNKAAKGKYKFLQKYYHRGVFFLDNEEDVFKRDVAQPTLEDHFDKTILPKVMQVKNFGKAGRTKYTHLVDQDTTDFNAPWSADSANNIKFFTKHAGGMKEVFGRPSAKRRKM